MQLAVRALQHIGAVVVSVEGDMHRLYCAARASIWAAKRSICCIIASDASPAAIILSTAALWAFSAFITASLMPLHGELSVGVAVVSSTTGHPLVVGALLQYSSTGIPLAQAMQSAVRAMQHIGFSVVVGQMVAHQLERQQNPVDVALNSERKTQGYNRRKCRTHQMARWCRYLMVITTCIEKTEAYRARVSMHLFHLPAFAPSQPI